MISNIGSLQSFCSISPPLCGTFIFIKGRLEFPSLSLFRTTIYRVLTGLGKEGLDKGTDISQN